MTEPGAPSSLGRGAGPPAGAGLRAGAPQSRSGLIFAVVAYCLWGFLPLYFLALQPAGAFEIVAWRVLFSLVFCAIVVLATRAWRPLVAVLRRPRIVLIMGVAGVLIYLNWQTYVYGVESGQVVEAALGYFINPIVTVFLGVIVLRERLRVTQWIAVGISLAAVVVLTVGYGSLPWIALVLAFTFGFYGLVKKQVGGDVDALSGLTLETAWLAPIAVVQLLVVAATSGIALGTLGAWNTALMLAAGIVTAIPLLLFAAAARRLPLVSLGLIQYFAPFIQFLVGVLLLHEAMPPQRWFGFALVWLALAILTTDMVVAARTQRRAARVALDACEPGGSPTADPLPE